MLEAAYAKHFPVTSPLSAPAPHARSNPSPPINGGTQGSGAVVGGDAVIEMTVMPSVVANGGDNNPESGEQSQP
jgi:hypothetical protein